MLAPSPIIKQKAKSALSNRFLHSVAISCVFIFALFAGELVASLASIFSGIVGYVLVLIAFTVFVAMPLLFGLLYYFHRLLCEQNDSILVVFKFFSSAYEYKRALHFAFLLSIRLVFAILVLYSPCIIVWLLSSEQLYSLFDISIPIWTSNLWALNSFIVVIASFALVFVMLKYYLSPFIFVANDDIDPAEAVNMSTIISKRTGGDFFGLALSFAGWILLSMLVAPLIFTLPYFATSYSVHCRFAITAYNRDVERFNASVAPSYSTDEI
ncbi:MAG: DUF975 family protein [Clostridia bacterium]|nr:DUF975 family protein [Clostridia bacterium]